MILSEAFKTPIKASISAGLIVNGGAILMVPSEFNIEPTMTPLLCISFTRGMVIYLGFMSNAYHNPIPLISEIISGNSDFAE